MHDELVARVAAEYDSHLADWLAGLTPYQMAIRDANAAMPYRPRRRVTIEREQAGAVYRSIHPYVGVRPLQRKKP